MHFLSHRTSRLLVMAKTDWAATALSQSFADRPVRKSYVSLMFNMYSDGDSNHGSSLQGEKVNPSDNGGGKEGGGGG